jgi:hypothetical protein
LPPEFLEFLERDPIDPDRPSSVEKVQRIKDVVLFHFKIIQLTCISAIRYEFDSLPSPGRKRESYFSPALIDKPKAETRLKSFLSAGQIAQISSAAKAGTPIRAGYSASTSAAARNFLTGTGGLLS